MPHVLLIEPDRLLADNIIDALKKHNVRTHWQVDPQEAMDAIDKSPPGLIILDMLLAGRSGVEFLYEFRSYPEWELTPIILYSSVSKDEMADSLPNFNHLNLNQFLYKPDTPVMKLAKEAKKWLYSNRRA